MQFEEFKERMDKTVRERPVMGWFCTYTPEEILHAAGYDAFGIRTSSGSEDADVYLGRGLCSYVHSCFGGAVDNKYDFLDAVVIAHCCECFRRMYDGWQMWNDQVQPKTAYLIDVPTVTNEESVEYFRKNLLRFVKVIEEHCGREITEESLIESINLHNETRDLLSRLYETRKRDTTPVSGTQVLEILEKSMTAPKEEFNRNFEPLLQELEEAKEGVFDGNRFRILIYGGVGNPEMTKFIEKDETGGIVVCEDACNGLRYFDRKVDLSKDKDPIKALSKRYLSKAPCPRMAGQHGEKVPDNLLELVKEYKIDGVICYITKFCENLLWEYPFIQEKLEEHNVPLKRLEGDISGDIRKIEIKSFLELLELTR